MNIGIIFFKFIDNTLQLYLIKNKYDKYEDIKYNNKIQIVPLYKYSDNTNTIYFLDIDRYKTIYDKIKSDKIICIKLSTFYRQSIHKYAKVKKLKNNEIEIILDKIKLNYTIRKKLRYH
jgi:hypothetical protein